MSIYIMKDIPKVLKLSARNDMLKADLGLLAYTGDIHHPYPKVIFST